MDRVSEVLAEREQQYGRYRDKCVVILPLMDMLDHAKQSLMWISGMPRWGVGVINVAHPLIATKVGRIITGDTDPQLQAEHAKDIAGYARLVANEFHTCRQPIKEWDDHTEHRFGMDRLALQFNDNWRLHGTVEPRSHRFNFLMDVGYRMGECLIFDKDMEDEMSLRVPMAWERLANHAIWYMDNLKGGQDDA